MRVYDARVGRFLSVDPLAESYAELTPYQFASNRPVDGMIMITTGRSIGLAEL
ncbi:hypothetical protein [Chitinophaga horti]|uniref:hypothetical protein n=1 Tax=Chitinophaga horti TaxID=2920382 RepID=UPI003D812DAA